MKTLATLALAVVVAAAGCTLFEHRRDRGSVWADGRPHADHQLGLSQAGLFDTPCPEPVKFETSDPGAKPNLPRPFDTAPPVIPHAVRGLDPITLDENVCLECHNGDAARAVPESHRVDGRRAPGRVGTELARARYVCTSCHVARTEAPPRVGSTFRK